MARLDSICSLNMGQSPESTSYNQNADGLPFFQGNADFGVLYPTVRTWCNAPTKIANEGDILISVRAPIGALNISNTKCCIGRGLAALTVNPDICVRDYLWHAISSKVAELNTKGTGSTFKAISKSVLAETEIPLPPLETQTQISATLDKVTELISMRKQQLAKLDELVKARFVEMFGDPVENPMGWEVKTLKEASIRLSDGPFGSNLKSEHYTNCGVRVIRLQNIGVGEFIDKDKAYVSEEHHKTIAKYTCRKGEIVIATLGEPNLRACTIPKEIEMAINKADCVHYIPDKNLLNALFVCQYINLPAILEFASDKIHGQTRARISSGQLAQIQIYTPPLPLQTQFADFVTQVDKSKADIQESLSQLETLKKALMQKYFG